MHVNRREWLAGAGAGMMVATNGIAFVAPTASAGDSALPPPITRQERLARIAKAQALMAEHDIGAVLIESGPSLDYFTGVRWGRSERLTGTVIPVEGDPIIVTPFFEKPSVEESLAVPAEVRTWHEDVEPLGVVADFLHEKRLADRPIGMEETNRYFIHDRLKAELPGARVVSANPVVRGCRMVKTASELALMQAANDITLASIGAVMGKVRPGMSERDVSDMLREEQIKRGGSGPWALVLFGAAAALPHGTGKPQKLEAGQVVLVDTGCSVHGYQSDISRTWVMGTPTAKQREVWNHMAEGQQVARRACIVGATCGSVDDAVRTYYESLGYGPDYALPGLSHRTGHGIGMQGHEPVNLVRGETEPLAPGMCFSNEPGLYLPGEFGIRLEDCFHMTEGGPRWFTIPPTSIDEPLGRSGASA
ncbi:M24 family metallopeptidase [Sphingomicrobium clamense]|uniref:Xaa-Pro peptidase family protein n=1 Tax=Sphingomicrobium clamense TaxID=2851013 RepID=A0ABS6V608_9SPHN|nr:Xaa-Pro peptidase family protein [Sphingomicrobium sp. B8]MBW0145007.1 Xaa-Pro peptidase family protein [Sphingomicrobium sp. B8]